MNWIKANKEVMQEYGIDYEGTRIYSDGEYIKHFELTSSQWLKMRDDARVEFLTEDDFALYDSGYETLESAKFIHKSYITKKIRAMRFGGLVSSCLGEPKLFSTDKDSTDIIKGLVQIATLNKMNALINPTAERIPTKWHEVGVNVCYDFTDDQILFLGRELAIAETTLIHSLEELIEAIDNCNTIDEVLSIQMQV